MAPGLGQPLIVGLAYCQGPFRSVMIFFPLTGHLSSKDCPYAWGSYPSGAGASPVTNGFTLSRVWCDSTALPSGVFPWK